MHIGLIGGIGPAATDYYYRSLIEAFKARGASLELTMAHADTATVLGNLERGDAAAQVAISSRTPASRPSFSAARTSRWCTPPTMRRFP